jgi:hypothetical protein
MTVIVTTEDKLLCAERELKLRERLYPRWIDEGRISEGKAELELAIMRRIVADYAHLVEEEQQQGKLPL